MRKFGIEIEFIGSKSRLLEELRGVGLSANDGSGSHTGWDTDAWRVKRDGSVNGGGELVSPPLDFDDPTQRAQVDLAVKALQLAGCRGDESAGIHVHVDASDMTYRQVAATGRFFAKFEDVLYRIASSGWEYIRPAGMSQYCMPLAPALVSALTKVRDEDGFLTAWYGSVHAGRYGRTDHYHGSRYHGLNLHSWAFMGTIEFRIFNSSVNPQRIQAYVALSVGIVQDAREGYARSTAKNYPLGAMADGTVSADAAFLRLQQVLTCDTKDSKRVVSKEDWKLIRKCWRDSVPQRAPEYMRPRRYSF